MGRWPFSPAQAEAAPIRWILNGPGAASLAAEPEASRLLENARPFVMRGPAVTGVPPAWRAVEFASFTKFGAIKNALERERLEPEMKGVMYDYEKWSFTPENEQRNPARYLKAAADLVHARGMLFLTAPALNLVTVMAPESQEKRYETYLKLGIAADAARYADVFDIQAQGFERNVDVYSAFVRQAAAQAKQANPRVLVFAGISTQPSGQHVDTGDILRAIAATRDVVDGYWFNIPRPSAYCPRCTEFRPDIAIEVMRRVSRD